MVFKVTTIERVVIFHEKLFVAHNEDDAREMAEVDETWSESDGWKECGSRIIECGIESVEEA